MERTVLPAALPGTVSARSPSRFAVWARGPPSGRASVISMRRGADRLTVPLFARYDRPHDQEERAIELSLEEACVIDDAEAA